MALCSAKVKLFDRNLMKYNFLKSGGVKDQSNLLPEVSVESTITHPRNIERHKLYEPIKHWDFIKI